MEEFASSLVELTMMRNRFLGQLFFSGDARSHQNKVFAAPATCIAILIGEHVLDPQLLKAERRSYDDNRAVEDLMFSCLVSHWLASYAHRFEATKTSLCGFYVEIGAYDQIVYSALQRYHSKQPAVEEGLTGDLKKKSKREESLTYANEGVDKRLRRRRNKIQKKNLALCSKAKWHFHQCHACCLSSIPFQVMSALVDIWTRELSKLREKDETIHSAASIQHESAQYFQEKDLISSGLAELAAKHMQVNKPRLLFSEASLSMLLQCFSP
ncbi:hypothetical protein VNO80_24473 [Phaseolus coccineus]|uniref:Uncharacterized protein n=1 Tax=Phaseolus coccineus TaxID=3886 RepID=A0AAN9QL23_PHACN